MLFWRKKLTEKEFTTKVIKAITKLDSTISIEQPADLELVLDFQGDDKSRIFLYNAYNEYRSNPKYLNDIINRHLTSLKQSLGGDSDVFELSDIVPIIKDTLFLKQLIELNSEAPDNYVYEAYNSELYIFYAVDTPNSIKYLNKEQTEKLSLDKKQLMEIACNNLADRSEIKRRGNETLFMLTSGGNYEASMILLNIWDKETFPVNGNIVVGIPSRDMMLVTGSNDSEGLHKMFDTIQKIMQEGSYLVSDKMFEWDGKKFEPLEL